MFSPPVCLLLHLSAGLCKNYETDLLSGGMEPEYENNLLHFGEITDAEEQMQDFIFTFLTSKHVLF